MPKIAPYGSWKSPITSDLIVAASISLSEVRIDRDAIYWLEGRPQEQGRIALVRERDGKTADVTPAGFNVRTRVHEYGGGAWMVGNGAAIFSNFADGRLYRQPDGEAPQALTPQGSTEKSWRYADGIVDHARGRWIGVREEHRDGAKHPDNAIVAVDLAKPGTDAGVVLTEGHDFYSSPRLSPDGRRLCWLAWDHPNMPWNGTTLCVTDLAPDGTPGAPRIVAGGETESIFQPEWSPDGKGLAFVSDRSGWWNLYLGNVANAGTRSLAPMAAEFGQAQWVFGMSTYAFAGPGRIVCTYAKGGLGKLSVLDLASGALTPLDVPFTDISSLRAEDDTVVFRGGAPTTPSSIVALDLKSGAWRILRQSTDVLDRADLQIVDYVSRAEPVEFPTAGGKIAYGLFYPPANADYAAPTGEAPPLVVKVHGGPTSAASSTLSLGIQFWTSRGIAVLDVNYGGSTGFGREYRERLRLAWGVVDVVDCINGVRHLAAQGRVDGARCVITGGSAGGYTALAALAFHDVFAGGASHYGVSDVAALAQDTHKFEARYLDWLIGPWPQEEARYRERSPIHHIDGLSKPVIFFQGDEDKVVPQNQTEMMVDALRRKGNAVGYLLFAGEQHGFRKAGNIQRSLDAELYFYAVSVFRVGLSF